MGVLQDLEAGNFSAVWHDVVAGWEGSSVGNAIDSAAAAAWAELQAVGPSDLLSIVENVGTGLLAGVTAGNPTSAIIATGITLAENAFAAAGKQITATTVSTFVSALHNQVTVTNTAANTTAPAATPSADAPAETPAAS